MTAAAREQGINGGAYCLYLELRTAAWIVAGRLGRQRLEAGLYVYVGSARRHLVQRVARHSRLAREKLGRRHWHIDALLLHRRSHLLRSELFPAGEECQISQRIAQQNGVTIPIGGFGATDCRARCRTHLYRLGGLT